MNREKLKELARKILEKYPSLNFIDLLPKETVFTRLLKIDITTDEFNKIFDKMLDAILELILKNYPYSSHFSNETHTQLSVLVRRYVRITKCTELNDDTFKYYPITIDEETAKKLYNSVLKEIIKMHIETGKSIDSLISSKVAEYERLIEKYKSVLKNATMLPYYGTPKYIIKHSEYILATAKMLDVNTTKLEKLIQRLENFCLLYPNASKDFDFEEYPYFTEEYKSAYKSLEEIYLQVLQIENQLAQINEQKWQDYLTDPNSHDDAKFRYLIHGFTKGFVPPNQMKKACAVLVTNSLLSIPYGTYGLIYNYAKEAVETIRTEDAGSWIISKEDFIEEYLPLKRQLQTPEKSSVYYEYENASKLVTPEQVEKAGINNNLKCNNYQPLTYNGCVYSEIFLNSRALAIGVFYTDDCKNVQEVIDYAKKYNLPVVHLSLQKLRALYQKNDPTNQMPQQTEVYYKSI